jgi:hypothetical protein
MKSKVLSAREHAELMGVIGTGDEVTASCEFSPGPWWGFNGIKTLVVTRRKLLILQSGFAFTARRDLRKTAKKNIDLISIEGISSNRRHTFLGEVIVLHIRTNRKRHTFTTKYREGENVVQALRTHIAGNRRG